ncbi:MAG: hypothetical protein V1740_01130 [Candidatus Woesearchaeota archaeon]
MLLITIILFFIYIYGLGFSITYFLKNSGNFWERNIMRLAVGLGAFPLVGTLINLLRIPLDWKIFLGISIILPIALYLWKRKKPEFTSAFKISKSNIFIFFAFIIFIVHLFVFIQGSYAYPYHEDDDSWEHARSIKYVAETKTAFEPEDNNIFHYIDSYPPGYDILMGMFVQTSGSVYWTMKFMNSLIISLGILFFYFFAKIFTQSRKKALYATIVLALLPSFLTHFIWAYGMAIILIFPLFYCLEMINYDKKWMYPSAIVFAGMSVTQPTSTLKIGLMYILYWIIKVWRKHPSAKKILVAGILAVILSTAFWWGPMLVKHGWPGILEYGLALNQTGRDPSILKIQGSDDRIFPPSDFFFAKKTNMINAPRGWGIAISLILILTLIYIGFRRRSLLKETNLWLLITVVWFFYMLIGLESYALPVQMIAFRYWALLAIPVALLTAEGIFLIISLLKGFKIPPIATLIILILLIFATAGYHKYIHNTSPNWPAGTGWSSPDELQGYLNLRNLPAGTKIFTLTPAGDAWLTGYDLYTCGWCKDEIDFKSSAINRSPEDIYNFINPKGYEYFILDAVTAQYYGVDETNNMIQKTLNSTKFIPQQQFSTNGMILFKLS